LKNCKLCRSTEKDIIDTIMLLLEHPLGDKDLETINIKYIAGCAPLIGVYGEQPP